MKRWAVDTDGYQSFALEYYDVNFVWRALPMAYNIINSTRMQSYDKLFILVVI